MKHTNQDKQDLLLDALSCIDDDILARGLALRDGTAYAVGTPAKAAGKTPHAVGTPTKKKGGSAPTPPLYDLSAPSPSPKKNPWRVLSAVAAACLLICVLPLSLWLVARLATENAPDASVEHMNSANGGSHIQNGATAEDILPDPLPELPNAGFPEVDMPLTEPVYDPEEPDEPMEEGIGIPITPYDPEVWVWNSVSALNGYMEKNTTVDMSDYTNRVLSLAYTATVDTFTGSQADRDAFFDQAVSPEDEMVLDMYAQYCLSLYTLDYGSHFLLFHPDIVKLRFTHEVEPYPYNQALGRINALSALICPYDTVAMHVTLTENRLLADSELTAYRDSKRGDFAEVGLDTDGITAVRRFTATGIVTVGGRFVAEDWGYGSEFYCYEYRGTWYLDDSFMDDDLCIDFALSDLVWGQDYLMPLHQRGVVTAVEDGYIYLEDGRIFTNEDMTAGTGAAAISVGDTVWVRYYDFGLPVRLTDTERGTLYRAISFTVGELIYTW